MLRDLVRCMAGASPWALPCRILVAWAGVPHLGAAVCVKAEGFMQSFPRWVCQGKLGLGVERQAQHLGLWYHLGETLPSSGSCPAHSMWGLGWAGRGSLSKTLGGVSVGRKICQASPALSSRFAWCTPLGSVADTEEVFVMLLSFPLSEGQKRQGWSQVAPLSRQKRWLWLIWKRDPGAGGSQPPARPGAGSRGTPRHVCAGLSATPWAPCSRPRPPATRSQTGRPNGRQPPPLPGLLRPQQGSPHNGGAV